jgi:ATP-dependent helicase/nuclease subunit A
LNSYAGFPLKNTGSLVVSYDRGFSDVLTRLNSRGGGRKFRTEQAFGKFELEVNKSNRLRFYRLYNGYCYSEKTDFRVASGNSTGALSWALSPARNFAATWLAAFTRYDVGYEVPDFIRVDSRDDVRQSRLDFDGATARLREWIDSPAPVSGQAVLVLTIHQAKGLEFPVVVLWDGVAKLGVKADGTPWKVTRDGNWAIQLEGLQAGSQSGRSLIEREKAIEKEEKKRLYYVAATRARDLLVVPMPNQGNKDKVSHLLAGDLTGGAVLRMEEFKAGDLPEWAAGVSEAPAFPEIRFAAARAEKELRAGRGLTAGPAEETTDLSGELEAKQAASRFGPEFGMTVHAALSAILRGIQAEVERVVSACAARYGLENHIDDAVADVRRMLNALKKIKLLAARVVRYPEYPVVMPDKEGQLIAGYIDLVACAPDCVWIIDFKTDAPPEGPLEVAHPDYLKQISLYKELLSKTAKIKTQVRASLLFSATGRLES